ncbi:Uncharacterized protein APZ42_002607, partial [Daphnia magna]
WTPVAQQGFPAVASKFSLDERQTRWLLVSVMTLNKQCETKDQMMDGIYLSFVLKKKFLSLVTVGVLSFCTQLTNSAGVLDQLSNTRRWRNVSMLRSESFLTGLIPVRFTPSKE